MSRDAAAVESASRPGASDRSAGPEAPSSSKGSATLAPVLVPFPGGLEDDPLGRSPRVHRAGDCRVVEHGRGARVFVGLHGWSGSATSFEPLVAHLPVDATLFAFDLPGAGESPAPSSWTTDALVDRIEAALEALGLDDFTLIAACGAVGPAMRVAGRRRGRVRRLILVDPFTVVPWYFRVFTDRRFGWLFYWFTFANPLGRWLTDGALSGRRGETASLTEGFASVRHRDNHGLLLAFCNAADVPLEAQATFSGPVDVLFGELTFDAVRASVDALRSVYGRARAYAIPRAGHIPMHEATEVVADLVFRAERGGASNEPATSNAARAR